MNSHFLDIFYLIFHLTECAEIIFEINIPGYFGPRVGVLTLTLRSEAWNVKE